MLEFLILNILLHNSPKLTIFAPFSVVIDIENDFVLKWLINTSIYMFKLPVVFNSQSNK